MPLRNATASKGGTCTVCGLRQDQLQPINRYVNRDGDMLCLHWFGIPAKGAPDYRRAPTAQPNGQG